ncbi:2OG-Fe(II) oxygenase family protein [Streptacidiphilus albus]|uniref:2OG-Fe(II) oxygenase family protein n=1 Tax=Streptacidiphilus albus TaxID=105425 RepID=UPI000693AE95|nr:2OG-Fe(II) oxygenase family protein [Streptacidiphilus albus]
MKEVQRGKRFVVLDDFLSVRDFASAQGLMEHSSFTRRESVISTEDGPAYRSKGARFTEELGMDGAGGRPRVYEELAQMVHNQRSFFGSPGDDWDRIAFAFWKYPAGSRLGWHNDAGRGRRGEFILFLHDRWRPSWGGELKLLDVDPPAAEPDEPAEDDVVLRMEQRIERSETSPLAIVPKPNRLVLVRSGTIHTISRVDPTAGDTLRHSLTGFVSKSSKHELYRTAAREAFNTILAG